MSLDTTLPTPDSEVPETPQEPHNRLANVLVNLQNKPQFMTIRPVETTPMTFDGKSEKFELFEKLFHTIIKMQPAMTDQMKINQFHSWLRKGALETFRNKNSINRQTLEDVLVIFRRKYVKPEPQATAKHKWHRLTFDPSTMKLPDFLEELNQGAEKAFGENAKSMIDSLLYAKLPPKLKRSVNMARLENETYEDIVAHLERELELNALEDSDDLPKATMALASTNQCNCCLTASTPTKTPNAPIVKRRDITTKAVLNSKRRKILRRKMARNRNVQLTHHVTHARKRIIQLRDVGKALALTCVPRVHTQNKKTQMPQLLRENLKQPVTRWLLIQANPIPK